jgi:hypothetical protein
MLPSLLVSGFLSFVESRPVKIGPTRCPETSVNNYLTTPCNHPKDHRLNIRVNATWRRVRDTIVAVEKQYYILRVCVCSVNYPACKMHVPYYVVFYGLSGSTTFFHIIT